MSAVFGREPSRPVPSDVEGDRDEPIAATVIDERDPVVDLREGDDADALDTGPDPDPSAEGTEAEPAPDAEGTEPEAGRPGDVAEPEREPDDAWDRRWDDLQATFVDDPRGAVDGAAALLSEALAEATPADAGTENLRVAFRRYRAAFRDLHPAA